MSLLDWHRRLETHFTELRSTRTSKRGTEAPIFALEHGLSEGEVTELEREIRAPGASPTAENALAWIVYATELGYDYTGDEYWQTFEERTPRWALYGHPHWIRDRFKWFAKTLGGARPSGAWAMHFSIICWPITHAILPNDLQRQLAKVLFDIRHHFSAELLASPLQLGQRIAAASWGAKSRFQNLSQNPLLLGQIATAILLEGELGSEGLLLPETLARIGRDLDKERREREWLRSARRYAHDRARFRGIENVGRRSTTARPPLLAARETVAELGIEPALCLRPKDADRTRWSVHLDIPDLSHLLVKFPNATPTLTQSRSRVTGGAAGWLARGRVLNGTQVELKRWPRSEEPLLEFERPAPELTYLLRTECLLRPGPSWIFRVASDGLAYELRSHQVRPGNRYVLLTTDSPSRSSVLRPLSLDCEGIHAVLIDVPAAVEDAFSRELEALGLGHAKALTVWPVGLTPLAWDGEGRAEWLVDDEPCIAVRSDHECGSLRVRVIDQPNVEMVIPRLAVGVPTFISLPQLQPGTHVLSIRGVVDPSLVGELEFAVRAPRPWASATAAKGPLLFDVDPAAPTLEALWDGEISINLNGPIGRRFQATVKLFDRDFDRPTISKVLPPLELPVGPNDWRAHFWRYGRSSADLQERYDSARFGEVLFSAEDLGLFTLRCEREPIPLRWVFKRDNTLRLIDEGGGDVGPQVSRYSFETPDRPEALPVTAQEVLRGLSTESAGGMYVASVQGLSRAIIVPPHGRLSFADLKAQPKVEFLRGHSTAQVLTILTVTTLWATARVTGNPLSASRRREVLRRLCRHLFFMLAGDTWDRAESQFERSGAVTAFEQAVRGRPDEARLVRMMTEQLENLVAESCEERVARVAAALIRVLRLTVPMGPEVRGPGGTVLHKQDRSNPDHPEHLTRFALQIASEPATLINCREGDLSAAVRRLQASAGIARIARFVVLAVDHAVAARPTAGPSIYAGWDWQGQR
jgi:hypothetical protein